MERRENVQARIRHSHACRLGIGARVFVRLVVVEDVVFDRRDLGGIADTYARHAAKCWKGMTLRVRFRLTASIVYFTHDLTSQHTDFVKDEQTSVFHFLLKRVESSRAFLQRSPFERIPHVEETMQGGSTETHVERCTTCVGGYAKEV